MFALKIGLFLLAAAVSIPVWVFLLALLSEFIEWVRCR